MSKFDMSQVEYGIDGSYYGIYDGVIVWVLKTGRLVNRWKGVPGAERRAEAIDRILPDLRRAAAQERAS